MSLSYSDGLICFSTNESLAIYGVDDLIAAIKAGEIRTGGLPGQWKAHDAPASGTDPEAAERRKIAKMHNQAILKVWCDHIPGLEFPDKNRVKGALPGEIRIGGHPYQIEDIRKGVLDEWAASAALLLPDDLTLPDPEPEPVKPPPPAPPPAVKAPSAPTVPPKDAAPVAPPKDAAPPVTRPKPLPAPQSPPMAASPPIVAPAPAPAAPPTGSPVIPAADFDTLARLAPLIGGKVETVTIVTLTLPDGRSFTRA